MASSAAAAAVVVAAEPGQMKLAAEREARIAARRKRIQERLAALRAADGGPSADVSASALAAAGGGAPSSALLGQEEEQLGRGAAAVLEANRRLLQLKADTHDDVTAVRVAGDAAESARRARDEQTRQLLQAKVRAEAEAAAADNAAIAARWPGALAHDVPQDLAAAIDAQRAACDAVIARKEALAADIAAALRAKDDEYVALLRRQAADVDATIAAMQRQQAELGAAHREALDSVERALLQERAELLEANRREVAALLDARAAAEAAFTERTLAAADAFAAELEALRDAGVDEHQELRAKLEGDIASLEQHLASMRAAQTLNAEKLSYNHRVLGERDAENAATISQQKRKLSRQHDALAALRARCAAGDARAAEENARLAGQYGRAAGALRDLQAKARHLARADGRRYRGLWRMQAEEAGALVRALLAADRVIAEQQLGWRWQAPDEAALLAPPHSGVAAGATNAGSTTTTTASGGGDGDEDNGDEQQAEAEAEGAAGGGGGSSSSEVRARLADLRNAGVLALLLDEAGFLAQPHRAAAAAAAELTAPGFMPPAAAAASSAAGAATDGSNGDGDALATAEAVARALGVTDGAAFDALAAALVAPDGLLAPRDDALRRLRAFVEAEAGLGGGGGDGGSREEAAADVAAAAAASRSASPAPAGGGALTTTTMLTATTTLGATTSTTTSSSSATAIAAAANNCDPNARRAAERERAYWRRLGGAVDEAGVRVWGRLEHGLQRYHRALQARAEGVAAVNSLRAENEELRGLLGRYLAAPINAELRVPPAATGTMLMLTAAAAAARPR